MIIIIINIANWLNANKISLNIKKTEMIFFKSKQKKFEGDLKIKLCGKRLYPTESVKYLGVKIDTNLSWQYHVNDLSIKPNRANALLFKMRKYVCLKILRSIYFAIFDSYLSYCCLVLAQNCSTIQRIIILQKKSIRTINLQPRNFHTSTFDNREQLIYMNKKSSDGELKVIDAIIKTYFDNLKYVHEVTFNDINTVIYSAAVTIKEPAEPK